MADMDRSRDLAWLLQRCGQRLRAATDAIAVKNGLTGGLRDYVVLLLLEAERPKTQNELGRLAGVDKTTLMGVLDRMEREGLVGRERSKSDRRVVHIKLTDKGAKLAREIRVEPLEIFRSALTSLTAADLKDLLRILMKLQKKVLARVEAQAEALSARTIEES